MTTNTEHNLPDLVRQAANTIERLIAENEQLRAELAASVPKAEVLEFSEKLFEEAKLWGLWRNEIGEALGKAACRLSGLATVVSKENRRG